MRRLSRRSDEDAMMVRVSIREEYVDRLAVEFAERRRERRGLAAIENARVNRVNSRRSILDKQRSERSNDIRDTPERVRSLRFARD